MHTTEQYEQLKAGQLDDLHRIIFVRVNDYPQLLSEVKQFWNSPAKDLLFYDHQNNEIDIVPGRKAARAVFIASTNLFHGIPDNYKIYTLDLSRNYKFTSADFDYMVQWKAATELRIVGDMSKEIAEGFDKLKEMTALRILRLKAFRQSFSQLDVPRILTEFRGLKKVTFDIYTLKNDEQLKFVKNILQRQEELANWNFRLTFGTFHCEKRNV